MELPQPESQYFSAVGLGAAHLSPALHRRAHPGSYSAVSMLVPGAAGPVHWRFGSRRFADRLARRANHLDGRDRGIAALYRLDRILYLAAHLSLSILRSYERVAGVAG